MKNLELKVKYCDRKKVFNALKKLNAEYEGILYQRDVYFDITPGRLKLRSINNAIHQLIYYKRNNRATAKYSNYYISEISHPKNVEEILSDIYSVRTIVSKSRRLFFWQNVRIHIDNVYSLGKFMEFEIICNTILQENESLNKMKYLKEIFNIKNSDVLSSSYSDMIVKK